MLRLCSLALALMASGLVAAPAPVFKPPKAPKTPYEVMVAELRKTGKLSGTYPTLRCNFTLTTHKVEGHHVEGVVLTLSSSGGGRLALITADRARIMPKESNDGVLFLKLFEGEFVGGIRTTVFRSMDVELCAKP